MLSWKSLFQSWVFHECQKCLNYVFELYFSKGEREWSQSIYSLLNIRSFASFEHAWLKESALRSAIIVWRCSSVLWFHVQGHILNSYSISQTVQYYENALSCTNAREIVHHSDYSLNFFEAFQSPEQAHCEQPSDQKCLTTNTNICKVQIPSQTPFTMHTTILEWQLRLKIFNQNTVCLTSHNSS